MSGSVSDYVGLIGGILVIVGIIVGIPIFLFRTFKTKDDAAAPPSSDRNELVEELRDQVDNLRRELRVERQARADDNDRSDRKIAELGQQVADLNTVCQVLRDRLDNRPPYNGQPIVP